MTRVEWTYTAETSRLLRALALFGAGAIGSLFVSFVVALVFVVANSLLSGEFAILAALLAFGLLGARRLASVVATFDSDVVGTQRFLSARELLAASVAWVVVLAVLVAVGVRADAVYAAVLVAVFVSFPVVALLHTEGYVDTDEGVFVAGRGTGSGSESTLAEVAAVRRYDFGDVAVLRVGYHDGTGSSARRLLAVPAAQADAVQRALVSSDADPPESDRNPLIAKTLYAFAVGSFALAAAFGYFAATESGDAAGVGVYVALFAGFFGLLFAWLGAVEG